MEEEEEEDRWMNTGRAGVWIDWSMGGRVRDGCRFGCLGGYRVDDYRMDGYGMMNAYRMGV